MEKFKYFSIYKVDYIWNFLYKFGKFEQLKKMKMPYIG